MGHIRLRRLPATKKWQQVVALLSHGASVEQIAGASAEAAEVSLGHAQHDPALVQSFWLLTQLPLAARSPDFPGSLKSLGLRVSDSPSLMEIVGLAVDRANGDARVAGKQEANVVRGVQVINDGFAWAVTAAAAAKLNALQSVQRDASEDRDAL